MRRVSIWLIGLSLALAGCSDAATQATSEPPAGTVQPTTTASGPESSSPAADTTTAPPATDPGRPVAPDFSLELADGGVYTLSQGTKPVYLVFWAEW